MDEDAISDLGRAVMNMVRVELVEGDGTVVPEGSRNAQDLDGGL